jgi:putative nucleotidyltransferase with HDIG domain
MAPHGSREQPHPLAVLLDQAQAAERAGRREIARRRYENVLFLLGREDGAHASAILRRIARTYVDDGEYDAAMDCAAAARAVSEALGETSGVAHAINIIAVAHWQRSDLEAAESLYKQALEVAHDARDDRLEAMIHQNLGIIANMRGDLTAALGYYSVSLETYRSIGDASQYVGLVLNNMGMAYTQLERWTEAQSAFRDALTSCDAAGDLASRRMVNVNLTDMWLAKGDVSRARDLTQTVFVEATKADDQRAIGESHKHLGIIARERRDLSEAERQLQAAYDNAMAREDLLLAAETAREQAELYEMLGRNRDTLNALTASHRLFTKLRAERSLADLARRVDRLESRFYNVVRRWAQTIESKDAYTLGHCERVAEYACALARDVGIDDMTMFWFRIGAVLHDVGKTAVPSEILNKPGPLTPDERAVMETHAAIGSDLLKEIEFPWDVLPVIRSHHERWDGGGYPDRLAGDAIPLAARITCVADVYDALTTDRPYRKGFSRNEAFDMMRADAGRAFDPDLIPRFERVMRMVNPLLRPTPAHSMRPVRRRSGSHYRITY